MKDNELFKYFKDRTDVFNEQPGDELWAKIENQLSNTPPAKTVLKKGFIIKSLLIVGIVSAGIAFTIISLNKTEDIKPPQTNTPAPVVQKTDSIQNIEEDYIVPEPVNEPELIEEPEPKKTPVPKAEEKKTEPVVVKQKKQTNVTQQPKPEKAESKKEEPTNQPIITTSTPVKTEQPPTEETTPTLTQEKPVFSDSELTKRPEFPGGIQAFYNLINRKFIIHEKIPPGKYKVMIAFVINEDGTLSDVKTTNDPGYGISAEVLKIFKSIDEKWMPAEIDGKAVKTNYSLPFTITIR
ncbi:hypothetical protein GN157_03415 [Flavobacterium rakeshii]|uniref:TonB C-terminal domain-containing protein n=1 Tax=Flavobacterium rakeshii TaxID=1038845 RepID=A0A6N8HDW5_9FLAO|nr:energy transducer TonB [Flavobacterium rakeshii]MUV02747.1 hypothetical protein [Flavobacterium rakeshii]